MEHGGANKRQDLLDPGTRFWQPEAPSKEGNRPLLRHSCYNESHLTWPLGQNSLYFFCHARYVCFKRQIQRASLRGHVGGEGLPEDLSMAELASLPDVFSGLNLNLNLYLSQKGAC